MAWKDGLKGVWGGALRGVGLRSAVLGGLRTGLLGQPAGHVFRRPLAMAGYRRCKGLKNRRFAYAVTGIFTLLASVLSPVVAAAAYRLEAGIFLTILTPAYWAKAWIVHLYMSGLAMLVFWGHRGKLQVYIDPSLGPRYEAGKYAGGLMYNMCPMQLGRTGGPPAVLCGRQAGSGRGASAHGPGPAEGQDLFRGGDRGSGPGKKHREQRALRQGSSGAGQICLEHGQCRPAVPLPAGTQCQV